MVIVVAVIIRASNNNQHDVKGSLISAAVGRLFGELQSGLAAVALAAWLEARTLRRSRRRAAAGGGLLEAWRHADAAAWAKAVFCGWIGVLILVRAASVGLDLQQASAALQAHQVMELEYVRSARSHKSELGSWAISVARATVSIAPMCFSRLTTRSAVRQWAWLTVKHRWARLLVRRMQEKTGAAAVRTCFASWRGAARQTRAAALALDAEVIRGNHLSNTTCLAHVFLKTDE